MNLVNEKALVVLSGGQVSVTCLGYALNRHRPIETISFDYNQRHAIELECAQEIRDRLALPFRKVRLGDLLKDLVTSALVGDGEVGLPHAYKPGLPSSFVPGRNALFLTLAYAYAQEIGAGVIYTGVCQIDYSGYPDCRLDFIKALEAALNIGYETKIKIETPLMHLTKAQTFALADKEGFLSTVIEFSHTCYNGNHTTKHDWGYGCGTCPACELRAKGFKEFVEMAPTNNWD